MITFNVRNIFQFQLMGQSFHYTEVRTQNSRCWEEELENGKENMVLGLLKSNNKLTYNDEKADEGLILHPYSWDSDA